MKMKKLVAVLATAAMVLGLVGCGETTSTSDTDSTTSTSVEASTSAEASASEETPAEPVTLRMAWWGSQTRHDRTIAVIELYESLNPYVTIEYEPMDFDGYFNKLATLVASNDVWDIFQLGSNFPTYQSKIYTLNDFIILLDL